METKGIEAMSKEELIELVGRLHQEVETKKFLAEIARKKSEHLENILNALGLVYEAYNTYKER